LILYDGSKKETFAPSSVDDFWGYLAAWVLEGGTKKFPLRGRRLKN